MLQASIRPCPTARHASFLPSPWVFHCLLGNEAAKTSDSVDHEDVQKWQRLNVPVHYDRIQDYLVRPRRRDCMLKLAECEHTFRLKCNDAGELASGWEHLPGGDHARDGTNGVVLRRLWSWTRARFISRLSHTCYVLA